MVFIMELRGYSPQTQNHYLSHVKLLGKYRYAHKCFELYGGTDKQTNHEFPLLNYRQYIQVVYKLIGYPTLKNTAKSNVLI